MDIGKAITNVCRIKGMTKQELASKIGISRTSMYAYATGKTFPTEKQIRKICEGLGVSSGYLLLYAVEKDDIHDCTKKLWEDFDDIRRRISTL
jgi:transcriptional regulator with XRE-family HTH domain